MSDRAFAPWVRPIATVLAEDAAAVLVFARTATADFWDEPSIVEAWRQRDILAHLAGGNDQMVQIILRSIIAGEPIDATTLDPDTDGENARGVEDRHARTVTSLINEFEEDTEEMMELLSRLSAADEGVHPGGASYTLGDLMRLVAVERHDHFHLEQMRSARA